MREGYRFSYKGVGIYEALKKAMFQQTGSAKAWIEFKNSDACTWLPVPPSYGKNDESYFTKTGYEMFKKRTLPIVKKYIPDYDESKTSILNESVVYEDEYQFVIDKTKNTVQESFMDEYGEKITLKTAKQIASRIHSKYKEDSKPPTGNQNCQLCTWCAEAQFRGIDILPRPIYSPRDPALSSEIKGPTIVKSPTKVKIKNKDHIVSTVKDNPGSRYYIHVKWNGGTGGHEFLIINIDSNVYIMDAQQGLVESIDKTTYFDDVDYSGSYLARLDDKQLNRELLNKMNSMDTLVPWNWDKDVAYMKKHGMLGEDEDIRFIRYYVPSDKATEYLKKDPELKQYWETLNKETNGEILVDPNTKEQIGYGFVYHSGKNKGFIFNIEVMKKFRRQGFGTTILNDCVTKFGGVDLTVACDNDGAIKLYLKYGFEIVETVKGQNGRDEYYMKLKKSKAVQEAFIDDRTRPLVPVTDIDFDTVYYGDAINAGKTRVLDGKPLFVSPLKGIASIFSDRRGRISEEMRKRGYHNYDMGYIEWFLPLDQLQKPLKEVHVYIKRYPDLEPFEFEGEGYIHTIDISKLKDKICRFDWMEPDREILIAGVDSVDIKKVEKAKVKYYVAGVNYYDKSLFQEGAVMISQESFVQEDVDIGALASAGLAAWKGSKQLKAESMDISMFKRLPMTRENLEKYSSGHGTFVQDLENYRLTQSDDGMILVDEHDIVAGLVIVRRTDNGEVWITRLARSLEWKNDGIILQLAKLAVDEFDAEFAAIDQNNTYVSKLLLNHGWKLLEQESGMCLMKYVGGEEEDEASEYTATDEDKNKFDEIMSEYMLEWGSSGKLFYHLSNQRSLDGQVFKPRVPAYIEPYNPHETAFENSTTPRVCFSSTIEGALNAITVNVQRTNPVTFRDMYVYIPEKPINEYKHKTNKELIRDHDVYDANVTKEMWILEPVRLKLYGVIHVDQARSVKRKSTVKTVDGKRDTRNYFTYKWHWLVKPKVLDSNPFHYDTMSVCRRLADEVNHFKYGLAKNGKLDTNPKNDEWDKYWRLQSPEQFEHSGGGNCWDFVEWEAGYLDAYGIPCKKYYMSTINQDGKLETHTFIVVPNDGKYIYIEAAFKRVADEIHNIKEFDSLQAIFKYIAECMFEHNNCSVMNYGVFDYTDNTPKPGTDSKQYMNWITSKCKVVYDGSIDRKTKKRSESK